MKCLKVDEYIERTASVTQTGMLFQELKDYVKSRPGLQGRTVCDRIIRACNHHIGAGLLGFDHVSQLVNLVELSLRGYDVSAGLVQSCPLYMEKIVFHIVKNLSSLQVHALCSHVAGLLYNRLSTAKQADDDFCVLVRSCFSVLWNGLLSASKDKNILKPLDKFCCQIQALSFLLLLDMKSTTPTASKAPIYIDHAIAEFESSCGQVTTENASLLLKEIQTLFNRCWTDGQGSEENDSKLSVEGSSFFAISEMVLIVAKALCKAGQYSLASAFLKDIERKVTDCIDSQCTALIIGKQGVKIHKMIKAGDESRQALTECARALRSLSADLSDKEAHAVLEGCSMVVWAVESGQNKGLSGPVLLALFSFLEEYQDRLVKVLNKNSTCQAEANKLRQTLCFSVYQGFVFAHESMLSAQLESDALDRVLLYCQATAGLMVTELHKSSSASLVSKMVIVVSNIACWLYNQRLYDQTFMLVEILCRDLCKNGPYTLSADRLSRPFMLAVQSSRRGGQLERALDWVILWLKALGDNVTTHLAEPVSLWVKIKTDAARNSEEDIRLRTLRDGFGPAVLDEQVMLCLLDEELRAYKEVSGDTAQERYNTLCDLLDICHEESSHTHRRAVYLCEMAQVVCFQDFSEQTDCTAVDFTHEALRLLEEEPETSENASRLKDDKAHAFLWLYICTLEKNLQEGIENDRKRRELREEPLYEASTIENNDFDYEHKQKAQDSVQVYEGLHFDLAGENKLCQPLEKALDGWSALLSQSMPSVRNPKQTCSSIAVTAALFRLIGKPLKALEAYQLVIGFSRQLSDAQCCANLLCLSASLLLEMGTPDLAQAQLEEAEKILTLDATAEGPSALSIMVVLLKAQYHYCIGQVDCGVSYLCDVLKEVNEQRQSMSWYLLRARTLQTCSSYLNLDSAQLPQIQRSRIIQNGVKNPDAALYDSLKLLRSMLVTLVGTALYGTDCQSSHLHFIDQGNNLVLKWQLLSELLSCSIKMVAVRSTCGAINDARLQCLEALKLAIKLRAISQCAELLVMKAELALMQGGREESKNDLDRVRHLLELCTDFSDQVQRTDLKIKPRKGRPGQKPQIPLTTVEDDLKGILRTRWIVKEVVVRDRSSSPPLKAQPQRWLSSLTHESDCLCPCCSEPSLGRATALWAATLADLVLQMDPSEGNASSKLLRATLSRCKSVTTKVASQLGKLFPSCVPAKSMSKPSLMQDVVGRVYLRLALSGLEPTLKVCGIWKILEVGLAFVDSSPCPVLRPVKAGLMATKAIASLVILAAKNHCAPEELFSNAWSWNAPNVLKSQKKIPSSSIQKNDSVKSLDVPEKTRKPKKVKVPSTPVKRVPCTPVHKVKGPKSVEKAPKTASKLKFYVYDEFVEDIVPPVPDAPKRTKRSRFKIEFSDESDSEPSKTAESNEMADVPQKRTTARRAAKTAANTPAEKAPPKRQTRKKNSTAKLISSEDEETPVSQPTTARRGRTRKQSSKIEAESMEEPDIMRAIEEDTYEVLDISIEQLRASDNETEEKVASTKDINTDFEVLRRDSCCNLEKDGFSELRNRGQLREGPQTPFHHSDNRPDNFSLEDVKLMLQSAWLSLQHFPSPTIYSTLCALLALTMGQQDPMTTAMLHSQSLGITSRHRTIRHLGCCLRKLRKASNELADKMDALSLNDTSSTVSKASTEQRLSEMENIFSFSTADSFTFPRSHSQEFIQQIECLPPGVTVCLMSVLGVKPGKMGDSILLSRLEKGSAPVTVHIPTSKQQHSISWLVQEIDNIQTEQKAVSSVSEKAKWWEGRRALDSRVERVLNEMERLLGCWKSFLLPSSKDPELCKQSQKLCKALFAKGVNVSEEMLKAVLSASPVLSEDDIKRFGFGLYPQWDTECDQLLRTAVSQLSESDEPRGHAVLILDKYLQKLPWESISILKARSVSRMPSLHSLLGLSIQKETDPQSILTHGVDTRKVYYVLDPDGNLGNTQERFKEWFSSKPDWQGVCGAAPDSSQLEEAVATKDLYIYVGHGAGARFLNSQSVMKRQMRAVSLLFGCRSAALAVCGEQEGQGIILNYLIAGCPFVLGNLWDVTDRDIDRFTKALLESWLSAGSGAPLLDYMGPSRETTVLKHLIGAAPVVYGLPVHLQ
ncbi:separin [Parambassis ranga]|uniref:separase n=1 Tax=Parambassis ranga TaxID=210632 RepID=A0A6P7IEB1_9TELE|nr:separin [Parambassis ranga]